MHLSANKLNNQECKCCPGWPHRVQNEHSMISMSIHQKFTKSISCILNITCFLSNYTLFVLLTSSYTGLWSCWFNFHFTLQGYAPESLVTSVFHVRNARQCIPYFTVTVAGALHLPIFDLCHGTSVPNYTAFLMVSDSLVSESASWPDRKLREKPHKKLKAENYGPWSSRGRGQTKLKYDNIFTFGYLL